MEKEELNVLTKEGYIHNHEYMSYSRFSRFLECEAAAAANYKEPSTTAQLVGSYVDAYFTEDLDDFKAEHPEIFKKDGTLKSEFVQAEEIIKRIESDELFMRTLAGEKQKIMVGEIDGMKFKIKMDCYNPNKSIIDMKVMKDFNKVWSDSFGCYKNFIEGYNYDLQGSIYQEICRQNVGKQLPFFISAVTKETPADIGIFQITQPKLDEGLELVKRFIPRYKGIMAGEIQPKRCEKCAYCRSTKKARIMSWEAVGLKGDKLEEEFGIICEDPAVIIDKNKEE